MFFTIERTPLFTTCALAVLIMLIPVSRHAGSEEKEKPDNPECRIVTTMGTIDVELFEHAAPMTVSNFIGLAEGTKPFIDPDSGKEIKRPFYDGLTFHRVIDDFMIQGGCPKGDGTGGPGYRFKDEINADALGLDEMQALSDNGHPHNWLLIRSQEDFNRQLVSPLLREMGITSQRQLSRRKNAVQRKLYSTTLKQAYRRMGYEYDRSLPSYSPLEGYLAMANSGPNSNGSQFFINLTDTPWLTGKHTVFGKVLRGTDVVEKIGKVSTDGKSKPIEPVVIISIRVLE